MGSLVRLMAISFSAVVLLGFAGFVADELDNGSKTQQHALASELGEPEPTIGAPVPSPEEEVARERQHSGVREAIDDANDVLLAPFAGIVDSSNAWVNRGVPTLLALLLYGLGLGVLANALPAPSRAGGDWRTA
jgi:hypothetical protein